MPGGEKRKANDSPSTSAERGTNGQALPVEEACSSTSENIPSTSHCENAQPNNCSSSTSSHKSFSGGGEKPSSLRCGLGPCTSNWLQKLHTARWLLAILCICAFNQSFVINAIFPVGLSTLEKRFHLNRFSTQTGIISSWYDFAVLIAVFPVCCYGNYGHKGRWIAVGSLIMALGSMVCALSHFVSAPLEVDNTSLNSSDYGQCSFSRNDSRAKNLPSSFLDTSNAYFLMFLLGQTLHGFGATPLFSLGTAYLDENVSQKSSPVYLAIHSFLTSLGPIVGLFVGGKLLTIYDDFDRVDMDRLTMKDPKDPRWVGAWWIGFSACSIASLIIAFPIMMFARELPEAKKRRAKEMHTVSQQTDASGEIPGRKDLRLLSNDIWNILRSPTFVAIIVIGIFESIILNGFSAFMPKILEIVLSTTPTIGAYLSSVVIFGAAGGVIVGGILVRNLRLQVGGMLKMVLLCHLVALSLISCMLIQCPAREFVGITVAYDLKQPLSSSPSVPLRLLDDPCNSDCHCNSKWSPVCDRSSGRTYYSACYAGCSLRQDVSGIGSLWTDCRCLRQNVFSPTANSSATPRLVGGFCPTDCGWKVWLFLSLLFCSVVASFAAGIPTQQIMLRVIPLQQRTLGIAVNWTFLRLLGFIPGGVLFGYMIDTTCLKWQESSCGTKQSCAECLVYDTSQLSWTIMALAVACKLVAVLATIVGYVTYSPSDLDRGPLSLMVNDDRTPPRPAHANALSTDSNASKAT